MAAHSRAVSLRRRSTFTTATRKPEDPHHEQPLDDQETEHLEVSGPHQRPDEDGKGQHGRDHPAAEEDQG
jgi:hypothetical protein